VIIVAGIYMGANFTSSFVEPSKQGKPEIQNGQFVLKPDDSRFVHILSFGNSWRTLVV
jgi:hypothetical protein